MKNLLLSLLISFVGTATMLAAPTEPEQAQAVANTFYRATVSSVSSSPQLVYTAGSERSEGEPCLYVYNIGDGFVIVSADYRAKPILGYSTEGSFDPQDIPEGIQELLNGYCDEIAAIRQHVAEPDAQLRNEWLSLTDGTYQPTRQTSTVEPLLSNNNWQQNNGYNYYCPADPNGPAGKCYVGCCALSMGQVMHYWQHPAQGVGSHSYECNHSTWGSGQYGDYGTLSANFGSTTYNFSIMPNNLNSSTPSNQILAIAKLLYHCGVSIEMWYGNGGSMGFHDDIADALETHFKYDECLTVWKSSYNSDWEALLKSDLDLGRPIIYCAYAAEGGHEFVCDGYDSQNYFHFNLGWGGSYNGFYAIDNLNAQYNFNSSHGAVAHIRPIIDNPEDITDNDLSVNLFPNPANTTLTVESESPIREISIFDLTGRTIITTNVGTDNYLTLQAINISTLPAGTYLLRAVTANGVQTARFVKN